MLGAHLLSTSNTARFWPLYVSSTLLPSLTLSSVVSITTGRPNSRLEPGSLGNDEHSRDAADKAA